MDDKKRRALIKELSVAKNFEPSYSEQNRRWFVEKLIRGHEAAGLPDDQVESKTRGVVALSKGIVTSKRDFQLKIKLDKEFPGTERSNRPRRVEVLYGLIATDPQFADVPNEAFLAFMAARRYRAAARMEVYVNALGYFVYPGACPANPTFRVNVDATPFWERAIA